MSAATQGLWKLPGGIRLPSFKQATVLDTIIDCDIPPQLCIALRQHAGSAAKPIVSVGDYVQRGQPIAIAEGAFSAPIHASSSGHVIAIESRQTPSRDSQQSPCVVIETDGKDTLWPQCQALGNPFSMTPADVLQAIGEAGIVGLGGAAFPTLPKMQHSLNTGIDTLILNGVECEPSISCDDALMRTRAVDILYGARIMLHALGIDRCLVGVESDKPEAWQAFTEAAAIDADPRLELVQVPTVYPSGAEDQLVYLLTGREVPSGGFPSDARCIVHNVGTAAAVATLALTGEPLTSRVVTVTGDGIATPANYRVRLGTMISDLAQAAGGYTEAAQRLIMGGPMTGLALTSDEQPVTKACNCLLFTGPAIHTSSEPERACIRCGECARICPVQLQPQQLYRDFKNAGEVSLDALGLADCIECGCCDLVCPSHIALTSSFRQAKQQRRMQNYDVQRAQRARERFEVREQRKQTLAESEDTRISGMKASANADAIAQILARQQGSKDSED